MGENEKKKKEKETEGKRKPHFEETVPLHAPEEPDDASVFEGIMVSAPKEPNHIPPFKIKKPAKQKSETESQRTEGDEGE